MSVKCLIVIFLSYAFSVTNILPSLAQKQPFKKNVKMVMGLFSNKTLFTKHNGGALREGLSMLLPDVSERTYSSYRVSLGFFFWLRTAL